MPFFGRSIFASSKFAKFAIISTISVLFVIVSHPHLHGKHFLEEIDGFVTNLAVNNTAQKLEANEVADIQKDKTITLSLPAESGQQFKLDELIEKLQINKVVEQNKLSKSILPESTRSICPALPPNLLSNLTISNRTSLDEAERALSHTVRIGGSWWPTECTPRWRVAIIVPFRNRDNQIGPFLNHMHPFLQRQQLNYTIYIVYQEDEKPFNRAKLLNVGFVESLKEGPFDCFVFHDVDLLPEDQRHLYHCSAMPRHLNVAASNTNYRSLYKLKYSSYFGGVNMLTENHLRLVNGWSNKYWGWGGEDDDMRRRVAMHGLLVWRYPKEIARYTMLKHQPAIPNPHRYQDLYKNIWHHLDDGLNSLQYNLTAIEKQPLFTKIRANLDVPNSDEIGILRKV